MPVIGCYDKYLGQMTTVLTLYEYSVLFLIQVQYNTTHTHMSTYKYK